LLWENEGRTDAEDWDLSNYALEEKRRHIYTVFADEQVMIPHLLMSR